MSLSEMKKAIFHMATKNIWSIIESQWSISNEELRTAIKHNKQVYIFIDKSVLTEYEVYAVNKENTTIKYRFADDIRIYQFIEEIKGLASNNNI